MQNDSNWPTCPLCLVPVDPSKAVNILVTDPTSNSASSDVYIAERTLICPNDGIMFCISPAT